MLALDFALLGACLHALVTTHTHAIAHTHTSDTRANSLVHANAFSQASRFFEGLLAGMEYTAFITLVRNFQEADDDDDDDDGDLDCDDDDDQAQDTSEQQIAHLSLT